MSRLRIADSSAFVAVLVMYAVTPVAAQPFELAVKRDRLFGAAQGRLVFDTDHVAYETANDEEARQWVYEDLKQIQVLSPTRVRLATYEDQGWIKLGADRTWDFDVTGAPVSEDLATFLLDSVLSPPVIAVVPQGDAEPLFRVPVKLRQRIRGSHGTLELLGDRLMYRTDQNDHARVWRLADLSLVFQPDRHRLTVQAYEGGGDRTRAFEFDLKAPLSPAALEAIWDGMHDPSRGRVGHPE